MERAELLDILTDASRLYVNYVERQLAQLGIHSGQGSLLSALDILGPCSQKELADFRQVSPATISVMLGRMENRGLVRRIPSEEGGKRNQISLTEQGKAMADTLRSYMPQEADKVFAGLSQEELEAAGHVFRAISFPLNKISPLVGVSKPANILKMVVFPHPEGPKNVTNSPSFIVRLKS